MLRRARAAWPLDGLDLAFIAGVLLVGASLAMVWVPLAGVVVGAILAGWAILAALPASRQTPGGES